MTEADSTMSFLTFFVAYMLNYMQSFWSRSRQSVSFYHYGEKQSHWCDRVSFTTWILNLLHHWVSSGMRNELLQLHEEHCSFEALKKHIVAHGGLKTEAEKHGLGSSIELKLRRLAKTAEGSKAFSINTQAQWKVERLLFGNSSVLQGVYHDLLLLTLPMPYLAVAASIIEKTEYILSQLRKTAKIESAVLSSVYS